MNFKLVFGIYSIWVILSVDSSVRLRLVYGLGYGLMHIWREKNLMKALTS